MGAKELTASLPNLHLLHKLFISYCSWLGHIRSLQTSGASLGAVPLPQCQPPSLLSLSPRASLRPCPCGFSQKPCPFVHHCAQEVG